MSASDGAPFRHPIPWRDPQYYDPDALDAELRRVFDICHGCRRCFSLCDSFPRLFDLIDDSNTGELDSVGSSGFKHIVDACTLCDMCFMTMCPYTPPHEWDVDFPHLMLRYRAVDRRAGRRHTKASPQLAETDRNGRLGRHFAPLMNWGSNAENRLARSLMETFAGVHRDAHLPRFHRRTLQDRADKGQAPTVNRDAPAFGRKAVLYATCFSNYNAPEIGEAARAVLAHNGIETEVVYPQCCGMPQLEEGDIGRVADAAKNVAAELGGWIDRGYDIVALVASCALMVKLEWPLILPDDAAVKRLSEHSYDLCEYVVSIGREPGLVDGMKPIEGGIALHIPCHERAQNVGRKAADMLALVPDTEVSVIERCSGHGGSIGVTKEFHEVALKVGRPVFKRANEAAKRYVSSACPLAGAHIVQGMQMDADNATVEQARHPIQLLAKSYGLAP